MPPWTSSSCLSHRLSLNDTIIALAMGQRFVLVLLVLGNFATISLQASSPSSDSYVAAVVEYAPVSGATLENKEQIFMQNVAVYGCFMEEAAKQDVDIIVFPEVGLASFGVPRNPDGTPSLAFYVPEPGVNPCNDNSSEIAQGLRELSCSARRHGLYAVVNLPERVNCSGCPCPGFPVTVDGEECPPSGAYFHNTNVVFDRTGTIVARYRKFNLFGEPGFVPTQQPEFAIFDTDFGVTFGTFICFDILFEKPAAELVRDHSICDFAFPTAWFSEVPFLTAVQTQAAWAYSLDVNLLAAGYDNPEAGSSGSGIFLGRGGALQLLMPNTTISRLLVGAVPKLRRCRESKAAKARSRRAPPDGDVTAAEGDDDDSAVERTPLSAFHHIVHQRKLGHLDADADAEPEEVVDEAAPAFIHHTMYDHDGESGQNGDDDDSKPPSGEYETKVPPHFMGLQQADQGEEGEEHGCSEDGKEGKVDGDTSHGTSPHGVEQHGGIPEKKIPASTDTDPYGFTEPSQNPDLLKLYQDEPDEKLPAEFLEIEVPEERSFEPEHDQEYFRLPEEGEIPPPVGEREDSQGGLDEKEDRELLHTSDAATAAGDASDLSVPLVEEEKETKENNIDTATWEDSDNRNERMYDEERNATEQEIEDTRKQFEWLTDDKDGTEKKRDESAAVGAGKEAPSHDHIDDTDDVLEDDHGVHLLDDTGHEEAAPKEEHIDDTDDILSDSHDLHLLDDGRQGGVAPRQEPDHVDDTDDVLPEHHGLHEPDATAAADTSPQPGAETGGELTERSKSDTLADSKQPANAPCKLKKRAKRPRREEWRSRLERVKQKAQQCKCKQKHEEQESSTVASSTITEENPVTESSEDCQEGVTEETQPEEQQTQCEDQPEEQRQKEEDFDLDDTQPKEAVAEETQTEEQVPEGDSPDLEAITEDNQPVEVEGKAEPEADSSKPKRPCKPRERREAVCPPFSDGVLDDERVTKSTVGLTLKRDFLEVYKTFTLNTDTLIENSTVVLCHGTFCCNFHVVLEVNAELDQPRYAYRLAVFDGVRSFSGVATGGLQVCALIPCSRDDMDSCGMLTLPDDAAYATVFRNISISGVFSSNHTLVTANTVVPGLLPMPVEKYNMTSAPAGDAATRVSLQTTAAVQQEGVSLFTFAIYSRIFNRDGQPATAPP